MAEAVFAAIDIGSNTVHMLVAASDGTTIRRLDDDSVHLRLGADLELVGAIRESKVRDTADAVLGFVERAEAEGAREIRLLATQAVREAANRAEVVHAIESMTGLPVAVLDPEREAYFAVLGAALTRSWPDPHLVVDVGGASTQVSVAAAETLLLSRSAPVGSGRLASRFDGDPPSAANVRAVQSRIRIALAPVVSLLEDTHAPMTGAVVVGGAMKRVARVVSPRGAPVRITAGQLRAGLAYLNNQPAAVVAANRDVEADRVPMARAGGMILAELMAGMRLADCTVSPFGIREGAILDSARTARWATPAGRQEDQPSDGNQTEVGVA